MSLFYNMRYVVHIEESAQAVIHSKPKTPKQKWFYPQYCVHRDFFKLAAKKFEDVIGQLLIY